MDNNKTTTSRRSKNKSALPFGFDSYIMQSREAHLLRRIQELESIVASQEKRILALEKDFLALEKDFHQIKEARAKNTNI